MNFRLIPLIAASALAASCTGVETQNSPNPTRSTLVGTQDTNPPVACGGIVVTENNIKNFLYAADIIETFTGETNINFPEDGSGDYKDGFSFKCYLVRNIFIFGKEGFIDSVKRAYRHRGAAYLLDFSANEILDSFYLNFLLRPREGQGQGYLERLRRGENPLNIALDIIGPVGSDLEFDRIHDQLKRRTAEDNPTEEDDDSPASDRDSCDLPDNEKAERAFEYSEEIISGVLQRGPMYGEGPAYAGDGHGFDCFVVRDIFIFGKKGYLDSVRRAFADQDGIAIANETPNAELLDLFYESFLGRERDRNNVNDGGRYLDRLNSGENPYHVARDIIGASDSSNLEFDRAHEF